MKNTNLLGVSHDELEADKSLSGGNLSGSNGGGAMAAASANAVIANDEVMSRIY